MKKEKQKCGLSHGNEEEKDKLVYLVNMLPQSLLFYVFNFGALEEKDEQKYINSIIAELFDEKEKKYREKTKDVIFKCHQYIREIYDPSTVSLREMARFKKFTQSLMNYYERKNEFLGKKNDNKLNKIKSIINSIYLCYYIRLVNDEHRSNFDGQLKNLLISLVNWEHEEENLNENAKLLDKLNDPLKSDILKEIIASNHSKDHSAK